MTPTSPPFFTVSNKKPRSSGFARRDGCDNGRHRAPGDTVAIVVSPASTDEVNVQVLAARRIPLPRRSRVNTAL
jgi:hypothetical protein